MKRVQIILVVFILAGLSLAQAKPQGQTPSQAPAQGQQGKSAPAPGQQQTPAQAAPGQQAAPATPQAPPGRRLPPQAKTQEEFKAYQDANAANDAASAEKAAEDFAAKFKDSELRFLLYYKAMTLYQNENNADKAVDMGRKALSVQPNDPLTLSMVSTFLAERTRDTDIDKEEKLTEAMNDAQKALKTIDTDLLLPPNIPPDQVEASKNLIRSIVYAAIANVYMVREKYADAEQNFRKSIELNTAQPEQNAITYLRLSIVLDRDKRYQDALVAANKAFELSPAGSPQQNLAKQERERLLKLTGSATPAAQPQAPPKQ